MGSHQHRASSRRPYGSPGRLTAEVAAIQILTSACASARALPRTAAPPCDAPRASRAARPSAGPSAWPTFPRPACHIAGSGRRTWARCVHSRVGILYNEPRGSCALHPVKRCRAQDPHLLFVALHLFLELLDGKTAGEARELGLQALELLLAEGHGSLGLRQLRLRAGSPILG